MNNPPKSQKILSSKEEIKAYLGNISDHLFDKYIALGMPARYEPGGFWLAHADNIDEFFMLYTRVTMKNKVSVTPVKQNHPQNTP